MFVEVCSKLEPVWYEIQLAERSDTGYNFPCIVSKLGGYYGPNPVSELSVACIIRHNEDPDKLDSTRQQFPIQVVGLLTCRLWTSDCNQQHVNGDP